MLRKIFSRYFSFLMQRRHELDDVRVTDVLCGRRKLAQLLISYYFLLLLRSVRIFLKIQKPVINVLQLCLTNRILLTPCQQKQPHCGRQLFVYLHYRDIGGVCKLEFTPELNKQFSPNCKGTVTFGPTKSGISQEGYLSWKHHFGCHVFQCQERKCNRIIWWKCQMWAMD